MEVAIETRSLDTFRQLSNLNYNLNTFASDGKLIIEKAIIANNYEIVKEITESHYFCYYYAENTAKTGKTTHYTFEEIDGNVRNITFVFNQISRTTDPRILNEIMDHFMNLLTPKYENYEEIFYNSFTRKHLNVKSVGLASKNRASKEKYASFIKSLVKNDAVAQLDAFFNNTAVKKNLLLYQGMLNIAVCLSIYYGKLDSFRCLLETANNQALVLEINQIVKENTAFKGFLVDMTQNKKLKQVNEHDCTDFWDSYFWYLMLSDHPNKEIAEKLVEIDNSSFIGKNKSLVCGLITSLFNKRRSLKNQYRKLNGPLLSELTLKISDLIYAMESANTSFDVLSQSESACLSDYEIIEGD